LTCTTERATRRERRERERGRERRERIEGWGLNRYSEKSNEIQAIEQRERAQVVASLSMRRELSENPGGTRARVETTHN
jgi:hypothetical protein